MASATIVGTTTSGGTSGNNDIILAAGATAQVFSSVRLDRAATLRLERSPDTGTSFIKVNDGLENGIVLHEGKQSAILVGPGHFRVVLSPTDAATIIYLDV